MVKKCKVCFLSILFVFLAFFFPVRSAYAYVDPGTAGMLYQIVILFIGAILGYFAFLRKRIGGLFKRFKKKGNVDEKDT